MQTLCGLPGELLALFLFPYIETKVCFWGVNRILRQSVCIKSVFLTFHPSLMAAFLRQHCQFPCSSRDKTILYETRIVILMQKGRGCKEHLNLVLYLLQKNKGSINKEKCALNFKCHLMHCVCILRYFIM